MLAPRALRSLLCVLSCAWLHTGAASRLKSPALPIQSEREPLPSKGLSGKKSNTSVERFCNYFPYGSKHFMFGYTVSMFTVVHRTSTRQ